MDLVENMQELACDIITSFLERKEDLKRIRREVQELQREVDELLKRYACERVESTIKQRIELEEYVERLQREVKCLLERFSRERAEFQEELFEAQEVWAELERTMERLRREDP